MMALTKKQLHAFGPNQPYNETTIYPEGTLVRVDAVSCSHDRGCSVVTVDAEPDMFGYILFCNLSVFAIDPEPK